MEVFVFPLAQVLLYPSSAKPLLITEPRYIQMVHDAIETNTAIAIGFVDEPNQEYVYRAGENLRFVRQVVGYGKPLLIEEREDGSLVIFLQGRGKAVLGKVIARDVPYIVCEATPQEENMDISPEAFQNFLTMHRVLISWMKKHVPDADSREQYLSHLKTPDQIIGCYATYLIADKDMQQLVLETNDINEKINIVSGLIASGELV
ncbi:MAG: hypothetical protein BroJett040_16100 [Oligoflexia bacterium]|nr:MAG: hypothetical protein BroJett040_16100 [Oligoflexia bacterium]